eukprot:CAMPEP_0184319654 /NCGR_PEP_ID=MMETSP1049-20130417/109746_1 /TAXON_ID=77928 /ORGANISM="Proteomonas sulcata, Strain CCMP704" /LENGTH=75 /DNA_ID=CAMNT_0026639881 /DNA_START=389 /DNA_END=616 /DNA_ORIENTATION=+
MALVRWRRSFCFVFGASRPHLFCRFLAEGVAPGVTPLTILLAVLESIERDDDDADGPLLACREELLWDGSICSSK